MSIITRSDAPPNGASVVSRAVRDLDVFPPDDPLAGGADVDLSQPIPVYRLDGETRRPGSDALAKAQLVGWRYLIVRDPSDVSYADVFLEGGVPRFSSISRGRNAETLLEAAHKAEALAADLPGDCEVRLIEAPSSRISAVWIFHDTPRFIPFIDGATRGSVLLEILSLPEFLQELQRRLQPDPEPEGGPDQLR